MVCPSITSTRSVKVPPTSTSMVLRASSRTSWSCVWLRSIVDKAVLLDAQFATGDPLPELVDINLNVVRDRVAGQEIFRLHLSAACGAVEFDDAHPFRVGRKGVGSFNQRLVNLT